MLHRCYRRGCKRMLRPLRKPQTVAFTLLVTAIIIGVRIAAKVKQQEAVNSLPKPTFVYTRPAMLDAPRSPRFRPFTGSPREAREQLAIITRNIIHRRHLEQQREQQSPHSRQSHLTSTEPNRTVPSVRRHHPWLFLSGAANKTSNVYRAPI